MYKTTRLFKILEAGFKKFIDSSRATCKAGNGNTIKAKQFKHKSDLNKCMELCASDDKCNYLYFNKLKWCLTFKNCAEDEREKRYVGTTYMKTGNNTR